MSKLFKSRRPSFEYLHKKWTARQRVAQDDFWEKHGQSLKQLAVGSLGGLLLLSTPSSKNPDHQLIVSQDDVIKNYDENVLLTSSLAEIMPKEIRPLDKTQEEEIVKLLSKSFGFTITAQLEGISLNRNYGLIGGEQHLYRYPGDSLYAHSDTSVDFAKYGSAGIAPSLGAWGYFANSKEDFNEVAKMRERYYLAIQTFLVPGYAEKVAKYRDFFKFRKMLVVNPKTGQAVVAVIGDAGPSEWTGKHLGGSPEVMDTLGLAHGPRKGTVLYFFIEDPENKIPLGPIRIKSEA